MQNYFEKESTRLFENAEKIIDTYLMKNNNSEKNFKIEISKEYEKEFFEFVDKINFLLMEDKDNFYGYFLFQMKREIRFDISSPTSIHFKDAKYIISFNPIIFLNLTLPQMQSTIKHEILHIVSMHILRAKSLSKKYSKLALNISMDIVINKYLDNLAPYAITLESINNMYNMNLEPYETFEYYAQKIQTELDLSDEYEDDEELKREFDPNNTHNTWRESDTIDEKTILEFTKNLVDNSSKGKIDDYLSSILLNLKEENTLPWNLYLKKIIGTIEADKKKTITRRNRRQPNRLDLRGEIRRHIAKIIVAIDISASISDEEFNQAIKEIFSIIKNYKYEITIVECDDKIRRVYKVKSQRDVKERLKIRGATKFNEVFEYANLNKANLLIYFTDGKGEEKLQTKPIGYKTLWILSSRGEDLSLTKPFGIIKKLNALNLKDDSLDMNDVRNDGYSMNNQAPIL